MTCVCPMAEPSSGPWVPQIVPGITLEAWLLCWCLYSMAFVFSAAALGAEAGLTQGPPLLCLSVLLGLCRDLGLVSNRTIPGLVPSACSISER